VSAEGRRFIVVGGAGFIGSHLVERLLRTGAALVTVYDNFSSGRKWHLQHGRIEPRMKVVRGDVADLPMLANAMKGHDTAIHLASNPDIAKAATEPDIDFYQGTLLTQQVLEAMRQSKVRRILYASGSGVYGERGETPLQEDDGPFLPISTYGASKLAGEALIASYCAMFGMTGRAFRFGNVVGSRQTHGVGLDFLRRLRKDRERLRILGDGSQSKPYIHVSDVVQAMMLADEKARDGFDVYNVATEDGLRVDEIARLALRCVSVEGSVMLEYTGGDRGWKGDVPVVRLRTEKIRALGWQPGLCSREAMERALTEMHGDERHFWI
jgi:UDP-glucose 4-epimerase